MTEQQLIRTTYRDPNSPGLPIRTGNTTRAESDTDMSGYYRPLEAIHNSSLHGWGVASGLRVTATLNSPGVTVLPGVALQGVILQAGVIQEGSGRHISLAANGEAEIGPHADVPGTSPTLVSVAAAGVALPTTGLSGNKYATIQFRETFDTDQYNQYQNFRYNHTPWLRLIDVAGFVDDGSHVVLAQVSLDANGNITALSQGLRRGLDLPTQSIHLRTGLNASPAPNFAVDNADAGEIAARATGGIDVTVANATDEIHMAATNGNFARLSVAAEQIVALRSSDGKETVTLASEQGNITVGAHGVAGSVVVTDASGNQGLLLQGGNIIAGTKGVAGSIEVNDANGNQGLTLQGGSLTAGTNGIAGSVVITDASGRHSLSLQDGNIAAGTNGVAGSIGVNDAGGNKGLTLQSGNVTVGATGVAGSIVVTDTSGNHSITLQNGGITAGAKGIGGSIAVTDANGNQGLTLQEGSLTAGTNGVAGLVVVTDASGNHGLSLQGNGITAGANGVNGSIAVNDSTGRPGIVIQGDPGASYALDAHGTNTATLHSSNTGSAGHAAVLAESPQGIGVHAISSSSSGIFAQSDSGNGIFAQSTSGIGMHAVGGGASPTSGTSAPISAAVFAEGGPNTGLIATSSTGTGVKGTSDNGTGVIGGSGTSVGVLGSGSFGVRGESSWMAIIAHNWDVPGGNEVHLGTTTYAGEFLGSVHVTGNLQKTTSTFKIDHPLDPARKYLIHSAVESPDMKNMYDGVAMLDTRGEAIVEFPAWFEALNMDFHYQLTCIGGYAPVYIAEKVHDNRFKIAGGQPGMEVSWQITGIRQDAWAKAYRTPVEEDKPAEEQGYYLHPEVHGESEEKHVWRARYPEVAQPITPGSPAPGS